ncbi:hypothetical protein GIB67_029428 [Kingdonia uniflora]|uniref:Anaphase-promoting complex subunit 4-like WD40 domain-containing protein n=1 Tax=Kingdonia uniflora TaxID=39325 RepID=A0A7J7NY38_9MAGN|nr:hypothetical protein GIB67_029428 [Kingdonia uniflora]
MDVGGSFTSSSKAQSRYPLQEQPIRRRGKNLDRFIPNRSAMDMGHACGWLATMCEENPVSSSPGKDAYRKQLAELLNMNRTRILAFRNKPPTAETPFLQPSSWFHQTKPVKPRRSILQTSERTLDAPEILDDYYLNLLDWDEDNGPVTSVNWAPDGHHLAVGLNNSEVQVWDTTANRQLRTLRGGHSSRVGSLAWNNHILTTGGMDGQIVNNDVRIRSHVVDTYNGHHQEVCGLKWSASEQHLATGGNDNLLHIWDRSAASSNSPTQWLHRLEDHTAAVKALA